MSEFTESIQDIDRYQKLLEQRRLEASPSQQGVLLEFCEELQVALEEMRVANEELTATRTVLEQERQQYQNLFEFAPDGYIVTDSSGSIQTINAAAAKLLGVEQRFLMDKPLVIFIDVGDRTSFRQQLDRLFQCDRLEWTAQIKPRHRPPFPIALTVVRITEPAGTTTLRWMLRDVTQQQQLETARQHYQHELEARVAERTGELLRANRQLQQEIAERQQVEAALRQQQEREQLLNGINQRIRQSLQLDEVLNTAVAEVRAFLQVERIAIYRVEQSWDGQFIAESVLPNRPSVLGVMLREVFYHPGMVEQAQRGYVSSIADIRHANVSPAYIELMERLGIRASLAALLVIDDRPWGFLCVQQCLEPREWQPVEIALLKQIATQLEIAIQQSSLYQQLQQLNLSLEQQVQQRTAELERSLKFEALLRRLTDRVRHSLDEHQILETVVQELTLVLNIQGCDTALYNLDYQTSTITHECLNGIPSAQGVVVNMADFLVGYAQLLAGQSFQFCDLPEQQIYNGRQATTKLACPIASNQEALGDLWLFRPSQEAFDEAEVRLVQQVADQCAIAIRQARLHHAAEAQIEQMQQLNYLKDDFLSTVSHELRTPVTNMQMAIQMLQLATSDEQRDRYLAILQSECHREIQLINTILDLQRLEANTYSTFVAEVVHLPRLIDAVLQPLQSQIAAHQQHLQINLSDSLPQIIADRGNLERILNELLNNACRYTPIGGEIHLTLHYHSTFQPVAAEPGFTFTPVMKMNARSGSSSPQPTLTLTIQNMADVPVAELPRLFEKFYRIPKADPWKQGGTGLGLPLIQRLVEQLRGNLQVKSHNGQVTFTIQLPVVQRQ